MTDDTGRGRPRGRTGGDDIVLLEWDDFLVIDDIVLLEWDERHGRNTYLYRTKAGRFFLHHTTLWQGERDHIEPVSPDEARQYYEDLPEHKMSYAEAFGEEPEEA